MRLRLFGTKFTMQGRFYPEVFSKSGLELVRPHDDEQAFIHEKYMGELLKNVFIPETRDSLLRIVAAMKERDHVQGIILAGDGVPITTDRRYGVRAALTGHHASARAGGREAIFGQLSITE